MRRAPRQKQDGGARDWTSKFWRREFRLWKRAGFGKVVKRRLARRRRREPIEDD